MRRIASALVQHGRATEWLTSLVLLGFALALMLPGETMAEPSFSTFDGIGFDDAMVSTPLALIAAMRLVALYINGSWRRTPTLRMAGAVVGAGIFGFLAMAFGWPYVIGAAVAPSTGAGTYTVLALFEILAAYRSGADARLAHIFGH
ncbi:hypothetical protein [Pseudoroseicyclus sp. CXY001]|uniref:hypothetical protein n=1 Tax=Pseudoroseicyclus sp. CXY001 TaxID=3242492 RepID=UPI003570A58C